MSRRFNAERLSAKIARLLGSRREGEWHHVHWCPACEELHDFAVEQPFSNGARWSFDGNADAPSFSPSMNITIGPDDEGRIERCHYFVTSGQIQYCGDSTHPLAGQTIPLPDIPDQQWLRWRARGMEGGEP